MLQNRVKKIAKNNEYIMMEQEHWTRGQKSLDWINLVKQPRIWKLKGSQDQMALLWKLQGVCSSDYTQRLHE